MPKKKLPDIQNEVGKSKITINKVGVKDVQYPIAVLDKKNKEQHTVATLNMYVELPHYFRGTHMSRFIEILNHYRGLINAYNIGDILSEIKKKLDADAAHMEIAFQYFLEKEAPVTKAKSLMGYYCKFIGTRNSRLDFILEVKVPIMTLCPCSKEISTHNAHNQRCVVTLQIRWKKDLVWMEDLIALVESCGSAPVYALLKREDEKYITEHAYKNPMFVEDVVRAVATKIKKNKNISWFQVESESFESIHNHSAYAFVKSK